MCVSFNLATAPRSPALQLRDVGLRFALERQQVAEALDAVARVVVDVGVGFDRSADDAQHRDPAGERIGNRLPHEGRVGSIVDGFHRRVVAAGVDGGEVTLRRRRHVRRNRVEQRLHPDDVQARGAEQRKEPARHGGGTEALHEIVLRERALVEELLHERLVGLGHHLHELLARRLRGVGQIGGDVVLGHFSRVGRESKRPHAHQIDDATEIPLFANRHLDRNDGATAVAVQRLQRPLQACALALQPVHDDEAR